MARLEGGRWGGGGGGGGVYKSRFTGNKTAHLQFVKNMTLAFHTLRSRRIKKERFGK